MSISVPVCEKEQMKNKTHDNKEYKGVHFFSFIFKNEFIFKNICFKVTLKGKSSNKCNLLPLTQEEFASAALTLVKTP